MMPPSGEREEWVGVDERKHLMRRIYKHLQYVSTSAKRLSDELWEAGYRRATAPSTDTAVAKSGWRPISEAPRDGTWIQVYWLTMRMTFYPAVVFWDEGWQLANDYMKDYGEVFPTHWQPLPEIPQKQKP